MQHNEAKWIRELILSHNPDNIALGLVLNCTFKFYPLTAKFYKKYAHYNFWLPPRTKSVLTTEPRYYSWVALLNNELKTHRCYFWLDFSTPRYQTPWESWQLHITRGVKWPYQSTMFNYAGHPYTTMFRKD